MVISVLTIIPIWFLYALVKERKSADILYEWYTTHYESLVKLSTINGSVKDYPEHCVLSISYRTITQDKEERYLVHQSFKKLPKKVKDCITKRIIDSEFSVDITSIHFHVSA